MEEREDDLVQVPVPKRYLGAVYKLIGDLEAGGAGESSGYPADNDGWTPELLRRAYEESEPDVQAILKHLAKRPEVQVPSSELVKVLRTVRGSKANASTLAGVNGAFGHRIAGQYGLRNRRGGAVFPYRNPRNAKLKSRVYVMSKADADIIAAL